MVSISDSKMIPVFMTKVIPMNRPNVLCLFTAPSERDCEDAISNMVGKICTNHGLSYCDLGRILGVSGNTVSNAVNKHSLLKVDTLLRIGYFFPEEYKAIEALLTMKAAEPLTLQDRAARMAKEIAAIQRELDGQNTMRGAA